MTIMETIADAIKRQGWSQNRLSKESGVAQGLISKVVNGNGDIFTDTADRLMAVLGLTVKPVKERRRRAR